MYFPASMVMFSLNHVMNCTDLWQFAAALSCRCFPFAVRLRISSTRPIWKASMYDACLLVHALLRNIKRAASSRHHNMMLISDTTRFYGLSKSNPCNRSYLLLLLCNVGIVTYHSTKNDERFLSCNLSVAAVLYFSCNAFN